MTKNEFDASTKENLNTDYDLLRDSYRRDRREAMGLPRYWYNEGVDRLARRAAERRANPDVSLRCLATAPKRMGTRALFPSADGKLVIKPFVGNGYFVGRDAGAEEREAVLAAVR